jgi:hypothetical protein
MVADPRNDGHWHSCGNNRVVVDLLLAMWASLVWRRLRTFWTPESLRAGWMGVSVSTTVTGAGASALVTSPAPRNVWQDLADRDEQALVTQTPTWLDSICATWPFEDASRLYQFDTGLQIVVPMARRRGWPARRIAEESWPRWGMCGAVVPDGVPDASQARLVFQDLARRPALRVSIRFGPEAAPVWSTAVPGGFATLDCPTQVLDLEGGFRTVWDRRFHTRVRRAVVRAEKSAVEVEVDRTGRLVPAFQRLYEESIERWAEQQHEPLAFARWRRMREDPPRALEAVAERFGESCAVWMASCDGQPAAAIVVLRHGVHAKYWRGAMDKKLAHPVRANHLLHRLAIEDACDAGCRTYHMGDSRPGSSLAEFKESFGARCLDSPAYYRERLPLTAADRRLRSVVKRLIRFQDA